MKQSENEFSEEDTVLADTEPESQTTIAVQPMASDGNTAGRNESAKLRTRRVCATLATPSGRTVIEADYPLARVRRN